MFTDNRLRSRTAGRGWGSSAQPQSRRLRTAGRRWGRHARPLVRGSPEGGQGHFARRRSEERERRERYLDPCVHQARFGNLVVVDRRPRRVRLRISLAGVIIREPVRVVRTVEGSSQALRVLRKQATGALTARQ